MNWFRQHISILACFMSFAVSAQTVHVDSDRIVYRQTEKVSNTLQDELFSRAQKAITNFVTKDPALIKSDSINNEISAHGSIKLHSPYHLVKTVVYSIQLSVKDGAYQYQIDSVYLKEKERGGKTKMISSRELLKAMDISGASSWIMEKQLNEIDMNFQKLIDLMNSEMKKA